LIFSFRNQSSKPTPIPWQYHSVIDWNELMRNSNFTDINATQMCNDEHRAESFLKPNGKIRNLTFDGIPRKLLILSYPIWGWWKPETEHILCSAPPEIEEHLHFIHARMSPNSPRKTNEKGRN